MIAARVRSAMDLCGFVDGLEATNRGMTGELALSIDGEQRGAVFVEQGRICWVAARGLARRLTELLSSSGDCASSDLEQLFWTCRQSNVPLGEELVRRGIVSPKGLREALLLHSTESLMAICEAEAVSGAWLERGANGYSPRFTFATSEILCRVGAARNPGMATAAAAELDACFTDVEWGAAFVRTNTSAAPELVAMIGAPPEDASSLVRAGKWAASTVDLVHTFQSPDAVVCVSLPGEGQRSMVVFVLQDEVGEVLVVGEAREHGPARILRRRALARKGL